MAVCLRSIEITRCVKNIPITAAMISSPSTMPDSRPSEMISVVAQAGAWLARMASMTAVVSPTETTPLATTRN